MSMVSVAICNAVLFDVSSEGHHISNVLAEEHSFDDEVNGMRYPAGKDDKSDSLCLRDGISISIGPLCYK